MCHLSVLTNRGTSHSLLSGTAAKIFGDLPPPTNSLMGRKSSAASPLSDSEFL